MRAWRVARTLLLAGTGFYVISGCVLYASQDAILFPRKYTNPRPGATPPMGTELVTVTLSDGAIVEGWFKPGAREGGAPGPAVLFCHGNAELIDDNLGMIREYTRRGLSVMLMEYPGYGRSGGAPSQASITEAGLAFFDVLASRPEVDPARIVVHGRSLGGGAAAQVFKQRPAAAMIVESTFTSVSSMARKYAMPSVLVKHPFRTDEVIRGDPRPLLIFHGTQDEIIPVAHGRRLAEIRPDAMYIETPGDHNGYPPDPEAYWRKIDEFLRGSGLLGV